MMKNEDVINLDRKENSKCSSVPLKISAGKIGIICFLGIIRFCDGLHGN